MTCTKDCELIEEYREEIEAIAECFTEGARERSKRAGETVDAWADLSRHELKCRDMAEDLNMKFQGSGVARAVFSSVPDPDEPKSDPEATEFAECVFKFARTENINFSPAGVEQNTREVETWQELSPDERQGTKGACPLFAPLKDYDRGGYKWIIQPWAPPPGNEREVRQELKQVGLDPLEMDIHSDNVGMYKNKNESCVIDYGYGNIGHARIDVPQGAQDDIVDTLEDRGMLDVEYEAFNRGGGQVTFYTPKDLPGERRPESKSSIRLDPDTAGEVSEMDIYFPGFPNAMFTKTEMRTELAAMDLGDLPRNVETNEFVDIGRDFIGGNLLYETPRNAPAPSSSALSDLATILDAYDDQFRQYVSGYGARSSTEPSDSAVGGVTNIGEGADFNDVAQQWRNALESAGMRNISINYLDAGLSEPDVRFHPPMDMEPHPSTRRSEMHWNGPSTVDKMTYRAAEVEVGRMSRAEFRNVIVGIADRVNSEYVDIPASITGKLEYRGTDAVGSGDLYDVVYEVTSVGGFMNPKVAIGILENLTERHNNTVDRSIPV